MPWIAIANADRTPQSRPRRVPRWSLVPATLVPLAVVLLVVPCASIAHEHLAAAVAPSATAHSPAGRAHPGHPARTTAAHTARRARVASIFRRPALRTWLAHRGTDITAAVMDLRTGRTMVYRPGHPEHTASIVKVDILATLLHEHPVDASADAETSDTAVGMIENSDDDDATDLWDDAGGASAVQDFDNAAGLHDTTANVAWGLTTTTPSDQLTLLHTVLFASPLLTRSSRAYIAGLMHHISSFDTWGVTAGPEAAHAQIAFKNGWLPYDGSWQVNSIGDVRGSGRHYLIAVMTDGSATEGEGISTIEHISRAVWADLAPR